MKQVNITWSLAMLLFILWALPLSAVAQVAKYGETSKKGDYDSYIAQDGEEYKVGDKLKLGFPQGGNKTFTYITQHVGGTFLAGFTGTSSPCGADCAGLEYEIIGFRAGGKGQGFRIWSKMKASRSGAPITVNFENALQSGELIGRGYTSDQALQELKQWKDKLDLELITNEEYELKKKELSRYIK